MLSSAIYAFLILSLPRAYYSAVTLGFLVPMVLALVLGLRTVLAQGADVPENGWVPAVICAASLHIGLVLGFWLSGRAEAALWVADSYAMHLPGASNVAAFLHGREDLRAMGAPFDMVFLTHAFLGGWFAVFGKSPVVSSLALMLPKLVTVFLVFRLGKELAGPRAGTAAALVYAFSPTVLYYTTVVYKEAMVQMLAAAILLFSLRVSGPRASLSDWCMLAVSMLFIMNERFYLFFFFAVPLFLRTLSRMRISRALLAGMAAGTALFLVLGQYADLIAGHHIPYRELPSYLFEILRHYRYDYLNHPDVTPINRSLPYFLAFIKIVFTPFFTLGKFAMFSDFSYILIWGSFLNQAVIAASFFGIYLGLRRDLQRTWPLVMPLLIFLLVFAYVAPYIGRLRDSFYPIIAVYAGIALPELLGCFARFRGPARRI